MKIDKDAIKWLLYPDIADILDSRDFGELYATWHADKRGAQSCLTQVLLHIGISINEILQSIDRSPLTDHVVPANLARNVKKVGDVIIPDSIEVIDDAAFFYSDMTSVKIPKSVKRIQIHAFEGCRSLASVSIEGNVITGYAAFRSCSLLEDVDLSNVNIIGEQAFAGCFDLERVKLSPNCTQIGYKAFDGCMSLKEIIYSGTMNQFKMTMLSSGWVDHEAVVKCTDGELKVR